jgi:hypothetical protein
MMTLGTISDVTRPFERQEHPLFTTLFFAKTQKRVTMILSNSFIKNSPFHATNRNEQKTPPEVKFSLNHAPLYTNNSFFCTFADALQLSLNCRDE